MNELQCFVLCAGFTILKAVDRGMDREKVLLMLERKSVIETAAVVMPKKVTELSPLPASKPLVVPVLASKYANSIQSLLADVNNRYKQSGKKALSKKEEEKFVNDFDRCTLPYKAKSVRTRLTRIEQENLPICRIKGFIGYIESKSQTAH